MSNILIIKHGSLGDIAQISGVLKDIQLNFIDLARNVCLNNDKRAKIKSEINKLLDSNIKEIKQYADY